MVASRTVALNAATSTPTYHIVVFRFVCVRVCVCVCVFANIKMMLFVRFLHKKQNKTIKQIVIVCVRGTADCVLQDY
jgi:hypothetical protein